MIGGCQHVAPFSDSAFTLPHLRARSRTSENNNPQLSPFRSGGLASRRGKGSNPSLSAIYYAFARAPTRGRFTPQRICRGMRTGSTEGVQRPKMGQCAALRAKPRASASQSLPLRQSPPSLRRARTQFCPGDDLRGPHSPTRAKRGTRSPRISTVSANIANGRTQYLATGLSYKVS